MEAQLEEKNQELQRVRDWQTLQRQVGWGCGGGQGARLSSPSSVPFSTPAGCFSWWPRLRLVCW